MRISAGSARGVRLKAPKGSRPASEQVRQAVFNSLAAELPGARVLDLYCGSGAYGLEALSRGAERAVLVDADRRTLGVAGENARAAGFEDRSTLVRRDAIAYLNSARDAFDLVVADPPYTDVRAVDRVLSAAVDVVAPGGALVGEVRWSDRSPPEHPCWVLEADRRYGDTRVLVYRRVEPSRSAHRGSP